ncbi:YczE/YyaS/YitT family protein [Paenisporosarcina antarctica]|uniref:YitT family protein n=2 Tax=Paenisporosarcina antarctica TaxID=417367 RepID=A0A4P7A0L3_9BACL|nr:YitT family protein [Paenisporosarcina antarctica]QBP42173.1 YitT family protein [Paenisporosarcina antarctica]
MVGMMFLALGIALTIRGNLLGIAPWDVFHVGLFINFGLSIGMWSILSGLLLVLGTSLYSKRWPLIGTWLNMILVGLFTDVFLWLLPAVSHPTVQTVLFISGVGVMGLGVGMYIASNVGAGPRDSLMLILMEKTGWTVKRVRTLLEVVVAIFGWLLGGPIGVGTVIIALTLGYIVHYTLILSQNWILKLTELPK